MVKDWQTRALKLLQKSLEPIPQEFNELEWKSQLSENTERLAHHISALANLQEGGFLVFGVQNDGRLRGITHPESTEIIKKLGNIARDGIEPSVIIDYSIEEFDKFPLLFICIQGSMQKPVHLRGKTPYDSYIRSAGQTRKMTKQEVAEHIARSKHYQFEEQPATDRLSAEEVVKKIDFVSLFDLLGRDLPTNLDAIINALFSEKMIKDEASAFRITNIGAILFAKNLEDFNHLKRKAVRVIIYEGRNRIKTMKEQPSKRGYASGFEGLMRYINDQLPTNEVIEQALRKQVKMYPELAIRELVANALIHQDFHISGTGPMIEIFSDRIEIVNPGRPIISTMRFIDYPPRSRNELLASLMRRINICEERGSGIDKVVAMAELYQLPAPDFIGENEDFTKAILYAPKPFAQMDKDDRIRACYQHCVLKYVSNERMSNQTLRQRFKILDENYPIASRIIADTIKEGFIKPADPESTSKKYATYVPYWA